MAQVEVKVPDIGDFKDVAVIEVMVKPGETVAVDTSLIMVESDKASMEIPSSHAGTVKELRIKLGDKVSEGSVILVVEAAGAAHAGFEDLPGRIRGRRLHLDRRVGNAGLRCALVIELDEFRCAGRTGERRVLLEHGHRQRIVGKR